MNTSFSSVKIKPLQGGLRNRQVFCRASAVINDETTVRRHYVSAVPHIGPWTRVANAIVRQQPPVSGPAPVSHLVLLLSRLFVRNPIVVVESVSEVQ